MRPDDRHPHLGLWCLSLVATWALFAFWGGFQPRAFETGLVLGSVWALSLGTTALLTERWIAELERRAARRSGAEGSRPDAGSA